MAESAVVAYLRMNGFPWAERRALQGSLDQGDVTGTPGLCWEVKYANSGLRLASWIAETEVERVNSRSDFGILVIKPAGLGARSVRHWYAAMAAPMHTELITVAGKRDPALDIFIGEPFTYTAGSLAVHMAGQASARAIIREMDRMFAVTAMPPGCKGKSYLHYRVMYLEEMVRLLHVAGYGTGS